MPCSIKVDENWPKDLLPSFPFLKARAKFESSIMCTMKYLTDQIANHQSTLKIMINYLRAIQEKVEKRGHDNLRHKW